MRMRLASLMSAAALLPSIALAQSDASGLDAKSLKRANPNQLAVTVNVSPDCDVSEERAVDVVRGVLIRSRIKPLDFQTSPDYFPPCGFRRVLRKQDSVHCDRRFQERVEGRHRPL